jgi:hypothetical protein
MVCKKCDASWDHWPELTSVKHLSVQSVAYLLLMAYQWTSDKSAVFKVQDEVGF